MGDNDGRAIDSAYYQPRETVGLSKIVEISESSAEKKGLRKLDPSTKVMQKVAPEHPLL